MELKPCPFCGAKPHTVNFKHTNSTLLIYQVMCFSCNSKPKFFGRGTTEQRAIEAWNRRVSE